MDFPDPLPEHGLGALSDEQLIAYVSAMRSRGERTAATDGLSRLVFGHWENVRRRVALRVPAADVEDVTGEIMVSAIRAAFDGASKGEFVVWLATITKRRIADFHRRRERRPPAESLDAVTERGHEPASDGQVDRAGYLEVQAIIEELLAARSADHRRVIDLAVFEDLPAGAVAAQVPGVTSENAYQIVSRFRRDLRRRLAERDTDAEPE